MTELERLHKVLKELEDEYEVALESGNTGDAYQEYLDDLEEDIDDTIERIEQLEDEATD